MASNAGVNTLGPQREKSDVISPSALLVELAFKPLERRISFCGYASDGPYDHDRLTVAVVFFLFFFLFLIHFQQPIHIGLCRQSSRISSREPAVLGVGFFFSSSSLAYSSAGL